MELKLAYAGRSQVTGNRLAQWLNLSPNLARDPVAFDAPLLKPLRFREAISALHDVVISDLRFKPRDKSAYEAWKKDQERRAAAFRTEAYKQVKEQVLAARGDVPPDLEARHEHCRRRYWKSRQDYSNHLRQHEWSLWRLLMPCDPVVTVAPDVVFFECFSADESSYGCLTADRQGTFGKSDQVQFGTTNVDYSWDLYHHFQSLRSYRETRFRVDPQGFEVATAGAADYREEKIDLPTGWLRGFMQVQVAMGLPMRRVTLSREAVYNILAWLKRHKPRTSPRAMRFELLPGQPTRVVLEPWEQAIVSQGTKYSGPVSEPVRIWGTRRLLSLARTLPLSDSIDVYLLGTGLPSFWVVKMGELRLTLGLSGWTTNDWTRGSALDLLVPQDAVSPGVVNRAADFVRQRQAATFEEVRSACVTDPLGAATALNHLARTGQVMFDLGAGRYRWRQIMPKALGEADIGPENEELKESRQLIVQGKVTIESKQKLGASQLIVGKVVGKPCELLLDGEGLIKRGKCVCSHHFKGGIRMGPCRHLLALRQVAGEGVVTESSVSWYERLRRFANN